MRSAAPYPPGHPQRAGLRELLQGLGATSVDVTFESCNGRYRLLSYRTEPVLRRLDGKPTQKLKAVVTPQIRQALPPAPNHDGKRGSFSWALDPDRVEIGY